jgi:hypothetical protein
MTTNTIYNVYCLDCEKILTPEVKSSLWWKAHKHSEKGTLDALCIRGEECGCIQETKNPEAPYRITGINIDSTEFDIPCKTFVDAIKTFRACVRNLAIAYIWGASRKVTNKLMWQ